MRHTSLVGRIISVGALSGAVMVCAIVQADIMRMKDGSEFECLIIAKSADTYCIKYLDEERCELTIQNVKIEDVQSLTRSRDREIARRELEDSWNERIKRNRFRLSDSAQTLEPQPDTAEAQKPSEEYCSLDVASLDALFTGERLTAFQEEEPWKKHKGKNVTWTGEVRRVRETFGAVVVDFRHKEGSRIFDVEAIFPNNTNAALLKLRGGQIAVYTGRLIGRKSLSKHWEVGEAAIIEIRDE
ncbi:MAG: hypothetical protein C4532_18595 [Candidatus Abyssobacteria bacterium SURF_17]|uniref:Uncharacterized protein n=1 Tax=Candidatus Abyssobacteria bacterium SURF_17 TaxID=2093361 RepID=A0A419EPG5_9BACT|nr:MAG: hypothetical protein C4532_18595 [Candidatus Abyssubacteria bacterium SURF_17]